MKRIFETCRNRALVALSVVFFCPLLAAGQRRERVVDAWKPTNYTIELALDDQLAEINKARAIITVALLKDNLSTIDLDFGEMPIDAVSVEGKAAEFDRTPDMLNVHLPTSRKKGTSFSVEIDYHGKPKDGLIFAADKDGRPSVTGDNWPNRVHYWIPCLDHPSAKAPVTFVVTAPKRDVVVANGRLDRMRDDSQPARTWTYTESVPIPAYCMVIAVGEYATSKLNSSSQIQTNRTPSICFVSPAITPLSYYVPQSDAKSATTGFQPALCSVKLFSETIAPYPYEKLALIVGATRFGGMENSSAIVFTSTLFDFRGNEKQSARFGISTRIETVVAHEIAHQWFGDSVTESTWADLWLSEGFATYFAGLFIEKYDGEDAFRDYMRNAAERYFAYEKQRRAPIHDAETQDLMKLLNPNNYEKGAWVLHMLRKTLGDETFFRGLRDYYNLHKSSNANSADLRAALEKASHRDLKEFFARWVYASGHPVYELSWTWNQTRAKAGVLIINLRQTQTDAPFLTSVPIEILTTGKASRKVIAPTGKVTITRVPLSVRPTIVNLDPDDTLLKEATARPGV